MGGGGVSSLAVLVSVRTLTAEHGLVLIAVWLLFRKPWSRVTRRKA